MFFSLTDYLLFLPAVLVITLMPGPDFAIVVKTALLSGRRPAILCALGVTCGVAVHTVAAILGISAVIASSATLFSVLKWAGAAYLFWLGFQALRASFTKEKGEAGEEAVHELIEKAEKQTGRAAFRSGLLCNLLNPKVVIFVLTFFPQFIDPSLPSGPQLALLGGTWMVMGLVWLSVLVILMARIRPVFGRPAFQRWLNRTMGAILILFGLRLAAAEN
ncbi:LysE family translocator [Sutterella sp.]|uniref:LysE family translocator n=1 Tax=Sutterella sp. TaxID=1981025 RepID=UPI0026E0F58D|nr:LysE family translocator [Sutterella sp.]MDO5532056.1 LysE family translocator [Sutterella sp.]